MNKWRSEGGHSSDRSIQLAGKFPRRAVSRETGIGELTDNAWSRERL